MTSEARARPQEDDEVGTPADAVPDDTGRGPDTGSAAAADGEPTDGGSTVEEESSARASSRRRDRVARETDGDDGGRSGAAGRGSGGLLPRVLGVLLVLLLAAAAFLWFTRTDTSSIRTTDYVGALSAARSGVVDLTSFDYLTLDDDIRQIKSVATGDLEKESTDKLDQNRKAITDSQAVFATKVIGAGVTRADSDSATVVLLIETTQKSKASPQAQVVRFRIEVQLKKIRDRWLLSGISGT